MMCAATVLALAANAVGAELVGAQAGVFVATLAVGLAGGLIGYRLRRSPLVFIVPGVLMLVPGSAGFDSILQLLDNQTVSGITAAFDTFVTATVDRVRPDGLGRDPARPLRAGSASEVGSPDRDGATAGGGRVRLRAHGGTVGEFCAGLTSSASVSPSRPSPASCSEPAEAATAAR